MADQAAIELFGGSEAEMAQGIVECATPDHTDRVRVMFRDAEMILNCPSLGTRMHCFAR